MSALERAERLEYERRILEAEVEGVRAEREMRERCEILAGCKLNIPLQLGIEPQAPAERPEEDPFPHCGEPWHPIETLPREGLFLLSDDAYSYGPETWNARAYWEAVENPDRALHVRLAGKVKWWRHVPPSPDNWQADRDFTEAAHDYATDCAVSALKAHPIAHDDAGSPTAESGDAQDPQVQP